MSVNTDQSLASPENEATEPLDGSVEEKEFLPFDEQIQKDYPNAVLHYGDIPGEQWAFESGNGIVLRTDLTVVEVAGEDRKTWLTSLTTQVLTDLEPGQSKELLILDPQGRIEHSAGVVDTGEATWLITSVLRAEALIQWLESMKFMMRVNMTHRHDLSLLGTKQAVVIPAAKAVWNDPWPGVVDGGTSYFQGKHAGKNMPTALHVCIASEATTAVNQWLEQDPAHRRVGMLAWEAVRVASWKPSIDREVDNRSIPAELDWLRTAVHVNKGCYRGQESVARVLNLGRPPRRLVFLQLDGSRVDLPGIGEPIMLGSRRIGTVTSVARHADYGPIALAVVARNIGAEVVFNIDGIAAAQELIVPLDGKSAISPQNRPGMELNPELKRPGNML